MSIHIYITLVVKHQPSVAFYLPFSLGVCSVEDSVDLTCLAQGKVALSVVLLLV